MKHHDPDPDTQLTDLIQAWSNQREGASDQLAERVYDELINIARAQLRHERSAPMEAPELVHEAWLKLDHCDGAFPSRQHFFAFAALQMRRLLIDSARASQAAMRRGEQVTLSLRLVDQGPQPILLANLADALEQLEQLDPRKSRAFTLTELAGFDNLEVARILEVSLATVQRDLRFVRAWLSARVA